MTFLPKLSVTSLQFFGRAEADDVNTAWIFLEDGGDIEPLTSDSDHGQSVMAWMSQLHTATHVTPPTMLLPERGTDYYLRLLVAARARVECGRVNSALSRNHLGLLDRVVMLLTLAESKWDGIVEFCSRMPKSFAHGDFVPKNLRLQPSRSGLIVLPFDWEESGVGSPAVDLACWWWELERYWNLSKATWPHLSLEDLRRFTRVGVLFRRIAALNWMSWSLSQEWADKKISTLSICEEQLTRVLNDLGF